LARVRVIEPLEVTQESRFVDGIAERPSADLGVTSGALGRAVSGAVTPVAGSAETRASVLDSGKPAENKFKFK
jgi:hypothetical protein